MMETLVAPIPIENFHPILRKGRLIPQGTNLIYETESPLRQVVLPIELAEFLSRCNGQESVRSIIESLHRQGRTIPFKLIYRSIYYLRENEILQNGHELGGIVNSIADSFRFPFLSFKPILEISLGRRIYNDSASPHVFYLLAMLLIISSLFGISEFPNMFSDESIFKYKGSYLNGLTIIFIATSIMLSFKNFCKLILLLVLTGRVYNFSLNFNGFACYFKVGADSLFLISNKLYLTLFHVSMSVCYFSILLLVSYFSNDPELLHRLYVMSLIIMISDLNPFKHSEFSQFINSIYKENGYGNNSSLVFRSKQGSVQGLNRRGMSGLSVVFTLWALFWITVSATCLMHEFSLVGGAWETVHRAKATGETVFYIIFLAMLIVLSLLVVSYLIKIVYFKVFRALISSIINIRKHHRSINVERYDINKLIEVLEKLPLMATFSTSELEHIYAHSKIKTYGANRLIIQAGDKGESLFILLEGLLEVQKADINGNYLRVAEMGAPSIVGEVAVIEDSLRTANVKTIRPSLVLEIPAKILRELAGTSPSVGQIQNFRNAIIVSQFFASAPIFRDLSEETVNLLLTQGKIEHFTTSEVIYHSGDESDGFYLLVRGTVFVFVGSQITEKVAQGGFFGEISVLTDARRTDSVRAEESSMVLKITSALFWEILAKDIEMAMVIESVGESRNKENILALRKFDTGA